MVCRQCGTQIADKALICFRCGTATTEARVPAPSRPRPPVVSGRVLLAVMAGALVVAGVGQAEASEVARDAGAGVALVSGAAFAWRLVRPQSR